MSYDALVTAAIADELAGRITGARVERIYQPGPTEVLLYLHRQRRKHCLLLSAHPQHARVHLSEQRYLHPDQPAPFCMLLRKYLVGGTIERISQPPLERLLSFSFAPPGGRPPTTLIAELMGRRSNLILIAQRETALNMEPGYFHPPDEPSSRPEKVNLIGLWGSILGALIRSTRERNIYRAVLPGESYTPPPAQEKIDPFDCAVEELFEALLPLTKEGVPPGKALLETVKGVSPLMARELLHRAGGGGGNCDEHLIHRMAGETLRLFQTTRERQWQPVLNQEKSCFAVYPLTHLGHTVVFPGISSLLDTRFSLLATDQESTELRSKLLQTARRHLARAERKLIKQQQEEQQAGEGERCRLFGELLLTYGGLASHGAEQAILPDPRQEGQPVTIPLDPGLSVSANAQKYFKRYRKAKKALEIAGMLLTATRGELEYYQSLLFAIENSNRQSLAEIRLEMVEQGLIREKSPRKKQKKPAETKPLGFKSRSGYTILVGRNNRQNERLTFSMASRNDIWFHAREIPGSHVLLTGQRRSPGRSDTEPDIEEAALLAAYFSRARESSAVAVDYTEARHLRRAPGGKPGRVLYVNFSTITVNPTSSKMKELLAQQLT